MSEAPVNWDALLANYDEIYDQQVVGQSWFPPDEDYTVAIVEVDPVTDKEGVPQMRIWVEILDGDEKVKGKKYRPWWLNMGRDFQVKMMKELAALIAGGEIAATTAAAWKIITDAPSDGVVIRVRQKTNANGYPNTYPLSLVSSGTE